jgi:hypothetical protein
MPIAVDMDPKSQELEWKTVGSNVAIDRVVNKGHFVPFLESLKQYISIRQVHDCVMESFAQLNATHSRTIFDIWDGEYAKTNSVFCSRSGRVLGIQIYFYEVEVANPLGSKKSKYKVGVFYWTLMNFPPKYRSSLRSINLLAIANAKLIKKHGVDHLLSPFIQDMATLQNGVVLKVKGTEETWHGIILNFVGDMPASNFIAHFKESGTAFSPCRICGIHRIDKPYSEWDSIYSTHQVNGTRVVFP